MADVTIVPKISMRCSLIPSMIMLFLFGFIKLSYCQYGNNPSYGYGNYEDNIVSIKYEYALSLNFLYLSLDQTTF